MRLPAWPKGSPLSGFLDFLDLYSLLGLNDWRPSLFTRIGLLDPTRRSSRGQREDRDAAPLRRSVARSAARDTALPGLRRSMAGVRDTELWPARDLQ